MKYTKEVLDEALEGLRNEHVKERRVAATVFMKAACAELGTANTKPVKEWFVSNIEDYITAIKDETDSENIWRHLYTLEQFCARYILGAHLFKIDSNVVTEENVRNVEEKAKEYVNSLRKVQKNPKVLQGIASFFWVYEESFVWDIFTEVLKKKKDKLTLSHIGIAIRQCRKLSEENGRDTYISDEQRKNLLEVLEKQNVLKNEAEMLKDWK